jgi:hypothetical protein
MKFANVAGLMVVCAVAVPAAGQSTRVFPDAQCSYTLPGKDWVWLAPKTDEVALAQSTTGLLFSIHVKPATPDDESGRRDFDRFETDVVAAGAVRSRDSRRMEFNGFPSLRIEVVTDKELHGSMRLIRANDRLYQLTILHALRTPTADEETAILKRFRFTGQPAPPDEPDDDSGWVPRRVPRGVIFVLTPAGLVMMVIFGAWWWVRSRG